MLALHFFSLLATYTRILFSFQPPPDRFSSGPGDDPALSQRLRPYAIVPFSSFVGVFFFVQLVVFFDSSSTEIGEKGSQRM